jgi:NAD-dependent deacetylase
VDRVAAGRIVVLTGAGISKESGLDTFRDADGIWSKVRIEDVATPEAWRRDPARVQAFYNARRRGLLSPSVAPNAAHAALAELERRWAGEILLVTQNIDDLHERAGSRGLAHMHGELLKVRCERSRRVYAWKRDVEPDERCACCSIPGTLRPHVVWFGEMPFEMERIQEALSRCDLFVAVGTSGQVYPAAGFVEAASHARTVELNLEPTQLSPLFAESLTGPATAIVPAFVRKLLGEGSTRTSS